MISGILISLCLFIPGLAWVGLCGQQPNAPKPSWQTSLITAAGALTIGLLWNTLFTLFLLECGAFSPNVIIAGTLIFASLGAWGTTRRAGTAQRASLWHILPAFLAFVVLAALIAILPPRGEWLAGGWDPGVNINQGICASRQGAWQKPPTEAFTELAQLPFNPFIRHIAGRDELFPGIPMSPETGALQLTFYPLTPAWIAFLHTLGGMQAALQAMSYLALILANPAGPDEIKLNLLKMAPYLGYPFILLGAGGFLIRLNAVVRTSRMTRLDILMWLGLCAGIIPLAFKFAAELYPWATKRVLSSLPLFLCLSTAVWLAVISDSMGAKWKKAAWVPPLLGLIIVFAAQANRIRDAWQHTEYDGLTKKLDEIARTVDADDVLLVDHFLWATPLTLSFGLQAINGERLWAQQSEARTDAAMRFFRSQQHAGRRVFILTSTEQGLAVFPPALQSAILRVAFDPYTYYTIAHHRNGNGFPQRKHHAVFRLYEYVQAEDSFSQAKLGMKRL